jgi:hypothetical protein
VTVICAMTLFDYLSAWSVVQRDGEQLIPRPSKARMLGAALYSIEPGMIAFGQAARDGGGPSYLAPLPLRRTCGGAISSGRHRIDHVRRRDQTAEVSRPKVGTGINLPWNGYLR